MRARSWFSVVGLFSLFVLALSGAPAEAISNVSVTIPGTYFYGPTDTCADGYSSLDVDVHLTGTTNDSNGNDEFAIISYDGGGSIIDAELAVISNGTTKTENIPIAPGIGSLSNPVSRPFTYDVYDIPYYLGNPVDQQATANWVLANGTKMASTTFDPSFDPACAKLPLNVTAIPALSFKGLALLGLLLAAGALALLRRS